MGINERFCSRMRGGKRDLKQDYSVISINIRCLLTLDILETIESIHFSLLWVVPCERTTHECPGFIQLWVRNWLWQRVGSPASWVWSILLHGPG